MRHVIAITLLFGLALPATAQEPRAQLNAEGLKSAYDDWLVAQSTTGTLGMGTRLDDGRWVTLRESESDAVQMGELASVSKSVTAACALQLVEGGQLEWSTRLPALLGTAPDVTIGELITHTSGLGPDSTQATMPNWLGRTTDSASHFSDHVLNAVNARDAQQGTRGAYLYNNENYALLGLAIEATSANTYWETCKAELDLSDDISPSPRAGAFQPWGGLQAHPDAYVSFLETHFGPNSITGADPFALPHVEIAEGVYYGLGMVFRRFGDSYNFWHFGALCFPGQMNAGSYAVLWEGEVGALALYDACVDWPAMRLLDGALARAVYP
ncbi:serine hydrolase [Tateyamaria sp.]|uniref:serine hydrolase n=1 Tax=Tateyamaria sp. TaxID=1929288 RepID=UPI00329AE29E